MAKDNKKKNLKTAVSNQYVPSLKKVYDKEIVQKLKKAFSYSNVMEVPKLLSISLNIGLGDAKNNSKGLESALKNQHNINKILLNHKYPTTILAQKIV